MQDIKEHSQRDLSLSDSEANKISVLSGLFLEQLAALIGNNSIGLLADFPNHPNVGDSAIFLGEVAALRKLKKYKSNLDVADTDDVIESRVAEPDAGSVVLIHGGGNFGDIWPTHHEARLCLLNKYRNHRIIQLPQSIHFESADELEKTSLAIASHPDFHLMLRDRVSYRFALEHLKCKCYLVPDAAFYLGSLARADVVREIEVLALLRNDKEMLRGSLSGFGHPSCIEDWLNEPRSLLHSVDHRLKALQRNYPSLGLHKLWTVRQVRRWLYEQLAKQRLERGVRQLSRAQAVVTDRLHAWLLCYLMGIPVKAGDNSYRKITNLRETWGLI